jgi:hypothetical protein
MQKVTVGAEWPTAVPEPFSDGTPAFGATATSSVMQHLVFWASHGREVTLEEKNGYLVIRPKDGYAYWFFADGSLMQVL